MLTELAKQTASPSPHQASGRTTLLCCAHGSLLSFESLAERRTTARRRPGGREGVPHLAARARAAPCRGRWTPRTLLPPSRRRLVTSMPFSRFVSDRPNAADAIDVEHAELLGPPVERGLPVRLPRSCVRKANACARGRRAMPLSPVLLLTQSSSDGSQGRMY